MSGAFIANLAFRVVSEHGRTSLLQRQLREIDLLVRCVPEDHHIGRMRSRAYALRSIEYCEDIIVHLRTVLLTLRADDDIDALCRIVIGICNDVQDNGTDSDMNQMGSSSTDLGGHMLRFYDQRTWDLRTHVPGDPTARHHRRYSEPSTIGARTPGSMASAIGTAAWIGTSGPWRGSSVQRAPTFLRSGICFWPGPCRHVVGCMNSDPRAHRPVGRVTEKCWVLWLTLAGSNIHA